MDTKTKTLLDEFAMSALAFLASETVNDRDGIYDADYAAQRAYKIAQAMMQRKEKIESEGECNE